MTIQREIGTLRIGKERKFRAIIELWKERQNAMGYQLSKDRAEAAIHTWIGRYDVFAPMLMPETVIKTRIYWDGIESADREDWMK